METNKAIGGWFISFTEEEEADIQEALIADEYEPTPAGLREFVLDIIAEDSSEEARRKTDASIAETLSQYIKEHPEKINQFANMGRAAVSSAVAAIIKARSGK